MAFNINDIRAQLSGGGARNSHFQVQITNPVNGVNDFKGPFMIKTANLPTSTIAPIDVPYFGRMTKVAGPRTFDEWNVTVMLDEDFGIKDTLEQWMSAINSHVGNLATLGANPLAYKSQAQVTQYSKAGHPIREYTFYGLFPTTMAEVALDWGSNEIEEMSVTFAYDYWAVSGGTTGLGGTNE